MESIDKTQILSDGGGGGLVMDIKAAGAAPGHLCADVSNGAGRSRQEGHHGQEVGVVRGRRERGGAHPGEEGAGPQVALSTIFRETQISEEMPISTFSLLKVYITAFSAFTAFT